LVPCAAPPGGKRKKENDAADDGFQFFLKGVARWSWVICGRR
jgi:hypothetical protein